MGEKRGKKEREMLTQGYMCVWERDRQWREREGGRERERDLFFPGWSHRNSQVQAVGKELDEATATAAVTALTITRVIIETTGNPNDNQNDDLKRGEEREGEREGES